ncbi:hypothetical protein QBC36DRAFT_162661, partial [Triangularia setosa]
EEVPHIQVVRFKHDLWAFINKNVKLMEDMLKAIVESWQCYLYWLRLSLIKIGKLPARGESFTSKSDLSVISYKVDNCAFGRGKSYDDLVRSLAIKEKWPE